MEQKFDCVHCHYFTDSQAALKRHVRGKRHILRAHGLSTIKIHRCPDHDCQYQTKYLGNMRRHKNSHHKRTQKSLIKQIIELRHRRRQLSEDPLQDIQLLETEHLFNEATHSLHDLTENGWEAFMGFGLE